MALGTKNLKRIKPVSLVLGYDGAAPGLQMRIRAKVEGQVHRSSGMVMAYCTRCGNKLNDSDAYCNACGTRRLQATGSETTAKGSAPRKTRLQIRQEKRVEDERRLAERLKWLDANGGLLRVGFQDPWGNRFPSDAPCSMCHQHIPDTQMFVTLRDRINATYVRVATFLIPVCGECKQRYEHPSFFDALIKSTKIDYKVRKWLRTYPVKAKSS